MKRVMSTMYPQGLPEELLPYAGIARAGLFPSLLPQPSGTV